MKTYMLWVLIRSVTTYVFMEKYEKYFSFRKSILSRAMNIFSFLPGKHFAMILIRNSLGEALFWQGCQGEYNSSSCAGKLR